MKGNPSNDYTKSSKVCKKVYVACCSSFIAELDFIAELKRDFEAQFPYRIYTAMFDVVMIYNVASNIYHNSFDMG